MEDAFAEIEEMLVLEPGQSNPWAQDYYYEEEEQPIDPGSSITTPNIATKSSPKKDQTRSAKHHVSLPSFTGHVLDREARARVTHQIRAAAHTKDSEQWEPPVKLTPLEQELADAFQVLEDANLTSATSQASDLSEDADDLDLGSFSLLA